MTPGSAIAGALVAAAMALGAARPALAFVRYVSEDGAPFYWDEETVAITAYDGDFNQSTMTAAQVAGAITGAAAAWSANTDQNSCTYLVLAPAFSTGATARAANDGQNSLIFHNAAWCLVGSDGACEIDYDPTVLALTTDTANKQSGQLYDADIEVNLVDFQWADVVEDPQLATDMDLQNALTHEMGHLIGLGHPCYNPLTATTPRPDDNDGQPIPDCVEASLQVQQATMFPSATPGDTQKRTLAPDDLEGLCTIYPFGHSPPPPTPNDNGCQGCATAGRPDVPPIALAALAALAVGRRRRVAR